MSNRVLIFGDGGKAKELARMIASRDTQVIMPIEQHDEEIRADERAKVLDDAEKLLDKIAPDKVAEIKCDDGEIRNRPLIDIARVYEILEQMNEQKYSENIRAKFGKILK